MAKYGVQLRDANGDSLYPRTILEQIYNMAGSARLDVLLSTMRENLEGDIADTNLAVERLREDLNALLSNATLSGAVLDAIVEIKTLLDSNSSDVVEQLVTTMSALRDEAIRNVAQELTLSQKQQARTNVGAVGVKYTDNRGTHLEQAGEEIMPYTKAGNVEYRGSNLDTVVNVLDERSSETKEKVDTFLADADTSEQAIDKLKELQDYIKNDETSASQMLGDIAQNKQDIADNATNIEKESTRAKQVEMYLESQKANKSGYYENLSVGVSDNLSGRGEATESEFSFRLSGGVNKSIPEDGTARINSIKGNSVVNNQLVNNIVSNDLGTTGWYVRQGNDKAVVSGNKITITFTSGVSDFPLLGQKLSLKSNRKYYIKITYEVSKLDQYNRALQVALDSVYSASANYEVIDALNGYNNTKQTVSTICNGIDEKPYLIIRPRNYTNDVGETMSCEVEVTDLTKMFNGVNVPATVEEFESLYSNMPNEYNKGTIIDNHTTAIKSVGVNILDVSGDVLSPPVVGYNDQSMPKDWAVVGKMYSGVNDGGTVSNVPVSKIKKIKDGFEITCESSAYGLGFFVKVLPNMLYDTSIGNYDNITCVATFYDKNRLYLSKFYTEYGGNPYGGRFRTPSNCEFAFLVFTVRGGGTGTMPYPVCHLSYDGYMTGKYNPYPYYEDFVRELPTVEGGLKSAGTAYDEIRYNKSKDKWEHVQRVGSVDLGTLEWTIRNEGDTKGYRFIAKIPNDCKNLNDYSILGNILCSKYDTHTSGDTWGCRHGVSLYNYEFLIKDINYTDVSAFVQSIQGVILNYELATPIVTELDVNISPDYKVWDYGTEEAISKVLSTPVRINVNYGFNAVGQITDNTELIKELLARVAVLEAQVVQANSTNVEPIEPIVE